ncbi:nucleotidyl transferase AbiEii/AbiGii toxin family protein [Schleiferilactobacillus perolens]|uniref:Abortive infection protein n=1 Tax=Schleiferilactobacillus perolens DSM 12744 TaxID=1423792 RepID=A0A0R1N3J8_9LACO|nr:nucleotidyl transferase AbiEii/AbiGii toxin family protein [Schleiferilactobacillus perolens]KRL11347.1 abortive infection protein [Schleiferilactobacillus perolens DSM 12744]
MTPQQISNQINAQAIAHGASKESYQILFRLQELLRQLAHSKYRDSFVLKGGFELSTVMGAKLRTTTDLDITVNGHSLEASALKEMFSEIFRDADGPVHFSILKIEDHKMPQNQYPGAVIHLVGEMGTTHQLLSIDVSTGDTIYPQPIEFVHHSIIDYSDTVLIKAFPQVQMLADKLVTIYVKNIRNSRVKDLYDIHVIYTLEGADIQLADLAVAFQKTATSKGIFHATLEDGLRLLSYYQSSKLMLSSWRGYSRKHDYVRTTNLNQVLDTTAQVLKMVFHKIDAE